MEEPRAPALALVKELSEDRDAAERRFQLGIATARSAGEPVSAIANAAGLSISRTNALLEQHPTKPALGGQPLTADEVKQVLADALTVGIVPAGEIALRDYREHAAYICQPHRSFRPEMTRLGFYAHREISPHFARIRKTWPNVPFTEEEAARQQATGDPELAELIARVLATPGRGGHRPGAHKVMLLTPAGDPETITLPETIKHLTPGRGQAYVRRQRYTSESALRRGPKTTDELMRYELG